jgi:nucleoside-diphosphate-sugar epimerase
LGCRRPDYLPIDDVHPCYPRIPYSVSKRLGELMCQFLTEETGVVTVCLRLPRVFLPIDYEHTKSLWRQDAATEWTPFWEYGAFIDVRDVASAALAALSLPESGHVTTLLCANDIASSAPAHDMIKRILPGVPWTGGAEYDTEPYRALVDTSRAKEVLHWEPRYRWRSPTYDSTRSIH